MRITYQDPHNREIKLNIETLDDLWYLYNLIEQDDLIIALTTRKIEDSKKDDKLRASPSKRVKVKLGIRAERVEFHEFTDRLRVTGRIEQYSGSSGGSGGGRSTRGGNSSYDYAGYHTLNLEPGAEVTIIKPAKWKYAQLELLKKAVKLTKRPKLTLVAIEYDEATIAQLHHYGIHELITITREHKGKLYGGGSSSRSSRSSSASSTAQFHKELLDNIARYHSEANPLIILGPGFPKDEFYRFGKMTAPELFKNASIVAANQGGMRGILEVLSKRWHRQLINQLQVATEIESVETLFEIIAKTPNKAVYGLEQVTHCLDFGAVEKLLLTSAFIRTHWKDGLADKLLKLAEDSATQYLIVSTSHEAGKKLEAIGGIAAILRYELAM